jgi:hypothetical protein
MQLCTGTVYSVEATVLLRSTKYPLIVFTVPFRYYSKSRPSCRQLIIKLQRKVFAVLLIGDIYIQIPNTAFLASRIQDPGSKKSRIQEPDPHKKTEVLLTQK